MGCGTSKDIQPLPPQSRAQTSPSNETNLQQSQGGTWQTISTGPEVDRSDQFASKVAAESDNSLITADSSLARQIRQPDNSQATDQAPHSTGEGSHVPVQVAALEPAATPSTCQAASVSQSQIFSDNDDSRGPELHIEQTRAGATRHEEEVQPFQERVAAMPAVADGKSEGSSWAYLQKTYSNMDEAEQCTSEIKGHDDCPQGDKPSVAELHTADGVAMPVQAGSIAIQSQFSGGDVWSRNVPDNAWGDASAASAPAALPDAAHQHPLKVPSVITSVQAQAVVDDLGMQDVDEFEAELAALNNAKSA